MKRTMEDGEKKILSPNETEAKESPAGEKAEKGLSRPEKYLLAAALVMGAALILYNAVGSAPLPAPTVVQVEGTQTSSGSDEAAASDPGPTDQLEIGETINLNTATVNDLMRIPDMSESMARDIVAWRSVIGEYHSVNGLMDVYGISEKMVRKLMPYLRLE